MTPFLGVPAETRNCLPKALVGLHPASVGRLAHRRTVVGWVGVCASVCGYLA